MQLCHRNPFITIRTEGSILPADLLQRINDRDPQLNGLSPEDYHLVSNVRLNEAINQSWNRLLGAWAVFQKAFAALPVSDAGTMLTREKWLLPLFSELGYGRLQTAKAIEIEGRSYPISHAWQQTPIHLVSAKVKLSEYRKQNRQERKDRERPLIDESIKLGNLAASIAELDAIDDADITGIHAKQQRYEEWVKSSGYLYGRFLADAWCAAFVWKKTREFPFPITESVFREIELNPYRPFGRSTPLSAACGIRRGLLSPLRLHGRARGAKTWITSSTPSLSSGARTKPSTANTA